MEEASFLRAIMALAFVIGLLLLFAAGLKRFGGKLGLTVPISTTEKKIQILEAAMLDSRHRLVRVRVEDREHVIVLGGASPVVVESKPAKGSE